MAKQIPLSSGAFAIVDDEDFEELSKIVWRLSNKGYAERKVKVNGKNTTVLMHRVLNKTPKDLYTDHINGNPLDNRKSNLRSSTKQQNQWNRKTSSTSITGIKGVGWCKQTRKWRVTIFAYGKRMTLGRFHCLGQAIKTYNDFASSYHGEFARLNKRSA